MNLKKLMQLFVSTTLLSVVLTACGSDSTLPGSTSSTTATATLSSGKTTAAVPVVAGDSTVTIPTDTTFTDSSNVVLSGTSTTINLTYADNSRFLPAAAGQLPANHSLAAFIDLTIISGTQTVKTFDKPVTVVLSLVGTGVVPGDVVSLYSFNGTAWSTSAEGTVVVDANCRATFTITHLSSWAAMKSSSALFSSSAFLTDLSNLTKSYITPLLYTNLPAANTPQTVVADAQKSLTRLITVWGDFKTKYKSAPEFAAYSAKFTEIDTEIAAAGVIIQTAITSGNTANDLLAAHEALEVIRKNLQDMDRGNGFDYAVDAIKDFHDGMEPFALAVKGKTAATLTDADVTSLKAMFPLVESTWNMVIVYQFNKDHFGMTTEVKTFIDTATTNQTNNLKALKAALFAATPDKTVIATNGNKVKQLFLGLFFSFADFIRPFDADLLAADSAAATAVAAASKTEATSSEVAAALAAVTALESAFNKFKGHFATSPISIMGVLTWFNDPANVQLQPTYFNKISADISVAKTLMGAIQAYPADLTAIKTKLLTYSAEMTKLRTRMSY